MLVVFLFLFMIFMVVGILTWFYFNYKIFSDTTARYIETFGYVLVVISVIWEFFIKKFLWAEFYDIDMFYLNEKLNLIFQGINSILGNTAINGDIVAKAFRNATPDEYLLNQLQCINFCEAFIQTFSAICIAIGRLQEVKRDKPLSEATILLSFRFAIKKIKAVITKREITKNRLIDRLKASFPKLEDASAISLNRYISAYMLQMEIKDRTSMISEYIFNHQIIKSLPTPNHNDRKKRCNTLATEYLKNSENWNLSENIFCLTSYIFTIIGLAGEITNHFFEKQLNLFPFAFILSLFQIVLLYYLKKKIKGFNLFMNVFNKYMPSITFVSLLLFYAVKETGSLQIMISVLVASIVFPIYQLSTKYILCKEINIS